MSIPGLLIEYLVTGAMTLVWLMQTPWGPSIAEHGAKLPVLVLALYVAGMAIDMMAFVLTRQPKRWLRRRVFRNYRPHESHDGGSGTERQARIALYAPDLGRELAMRSSRDRIARGLIVNSLFAVAYVQPMWIGVLAAVCSTVMWLSFEGLSFGYELCAAKVVEEKLRLSTQR